MSIFTCSSCCSLACLAIFISSWSWAWISALLAAYYYSYSLSNKVLVNYSSLALSSYSNRSLSTDSFFFISISLFNCYSSISFCLANNSFIL